MKRGGVWPVFIKLLSALTVHPQVCLFERMCVLSLF